MNKIKKMILIALMFLTTLSYAEKKTKVNLSKVAVVEFNNAKKGQQLLVKDEYGIILYSETVGNNGDLSKIFDLKQLIDGKYTVELDKDFEILIKPFDVKKNTIVFFKNKETKVFKPMIRSENNKLLVSQMSLQSKTVEVEIYYKDDLIFSETVEGVKIVNRIYKLQDKKLGKYHVIIKTDNRSYIEFFTL